VSGVDVLVPADGDLMRLLRVAVPGLGKFGRLASGLANAADPDGYPARTVSGLDPNEARFLGFELAKILEHARADGDPGADSLAGILAQLPGAGGA